MSKSSIDTSRLHGIVPQISVEMEGIRTEKTRALLNNVIALTKYKAYCNLNTLISC